MAMRWIEPGAFEMGTSDEPDASPHEVEISKGFWLGTHEVTQGQWDAVMGGTDWVAPWVGQSHVQLNADYPATYVSWEDVQEFIARLNDEEGGRYYRLPTEAEWEYACRAGTTTRWSFGDDEDHLKYFAWYYFEDTPRSPTLKRANAWGLRGMHGNVREWVQDWYDEDYYANSPVLDPQGPLWPPFDAGSDAVHHRVTRGGGFNTVTAPTQSAFRLIAPPGSGSPFIGFRLVRDEVPQELPTRTVSLPGGTSMGFVRVEPGVFQMGSPESEENRGSDETLHAVEISTGFWLGQYEVTQDQWYAVMETTPWDGAVNQVNPSYPATHTSWEAVQAFIDRLNAAAGERRYRLPSEAEWEYACRAGMPTRWSFGDDERRLEHYAWYKDNASGVNEVGQKRPNFWGLYDMHGNVWEWVQDWYDADYYDSSPRVDPVGPDTGDERVSRGGVFANGPSFVRSALRRSFEPDPVFKKTFGFRLVMVDEPEEDPLEAVGELEPEEDLSTLSEAEARRSLDEQGISYSLDSFFERIVAGDVSSVELFIAAGMDLNAQDNDGYTALMLAAEGGYVEMVRLLVEHGVDVNAQYYGYTALMLAAEGGHVEVARFLVEHGADVNAPNEYGDTALMWAARQGHVEVARFLVEHGADVNAQNNDGLTALMWAVLYFYVEMTMETTMERMEMVRLLVEHGADVNAQNNDGLTALSFAKTFGNQEIIDLLEAVGEPEEDLEAVGELEPEEDLSTLSEAEARRSLDEQGISYSLDSFFERIVAGDVSSIELFIAAGMDLNAQDNDGYTALAMAVSGAALLGHVELVKIMEMVRLLVEHGADVNAQGGTALSAAAVLGYVEVARFLVEHGADVNAQNNDGWTALMAAAMFGRVEVARFLVEHGADVNAQTNDGYTALMRAVTIGGGRRVEMVRFLVDHGADVNAQDNYGGTALMYAKLSGNQEIIDLLEAAGATE